MSVDIVKNLSILRNRIEKICNKIKRDPSEITIVAVAKGVEPERIKEAIDNGIRIIGENRVQEATEKEKKIGNLCEWHMVGHLQTNKVKPALKIFSMIQSVDSLHLAQEIQKRASEMNKIAPILIEVNTSDEPTKFGVSSEGLFSLIKEIENMSALRLMGLMTLGPGLAVENPENSRPSFRKLYQLRDEAQKEFGCSLPYLSMGMSSDFEVAIEEGSNMLRIGTLIFGPRNEQKKFEKEM